MIAYDVVSDARRTRIAKLLEDYGQRVQYSLFECSLTADELAELRTQLHAKIDRVTDSVAIYALCRPCAERILYLGRDRLPPHSSYLIV